jgi:hypothetical protein
MAWDVIVYATAQGSVPGADFLKLSRAGSWNGPGRAVAQLCETVERVLKDTGMAEGELAGLLDLRVH